eukprot:3398676-Rhodomonas_salina.4
MKPNTQIKQQQTTTQTSANPSDSNTNNEQTSHPFAIGGVNEGWSLATFKFITGSDFPNTLPISNVMFNAEKDDPTRVGATTRQSREAQEHHLQLGEFQTGEPHSNQGLTACARYAKSGTDAAHYSWPFGDAFSDKKDPKPPKAENDVVLPPPPPPSFGLTKVLFASPPRRFLVLFLAQSSPMLAFCLL